MDHFQGNSDAAASDAKRAADRNTDRITVLEREVARLGQIVDRLVRKAGKL